MCWSPGFYELRRRWSPRLGVQETVWLTIAAVGMQLSALITGATTGRLTVMSWELVSQPLVADLQVNSLLTLGPKMETSRRFEATKREVPIWTSLHQLLVFEGAARNSATRF